MAQIRIVIDTNVLIAALRSPSGASFQVLRLIGGGDFELAISVPLVLEYESVAKREVDKLPIDAEDIDDLIDYICRVAQHTEIFYTWRPQLRDPDDEMALELAIGSRSDAIVPFNKRDFVGAERFGIRIVTPVELLQELGVVK
jgi:putative PIN family toxin of toxin-antitoxin system